MSAVTIPDSLIKRLQALGPHFCMVYSEQQKHPDPKQDWKKRPVGYDWQNHLMFADDPELQEWLAKGGNYGVVGGYGLVIADADIPEIKQILKEQLPETFTVESPGSHGWHAYFLCGLEKPIRLRDKNGENVGDIQGPGKMVLGPNSVHPNGDVYRIVKDLPLAQVTAQQLRETLKDWTVPEKEIQKVEFAASQEKRDNVDLDILQVVPLSGLRKRGSEYFGPHPIHGSNTKQNFWVNPSKNCWHCFRHGSGGGPLLWLAVEQGIIDCSEAGSGALRGDLFKQVKKIAVDKSFITNDVGSSTTKTKKANSPRKNKKKEEDEKKSKEKFVPFIELMDGRLAEQAYDGMQVFFLVYNPKTSKVEKPYEIPLETITLKPIGNDEVYTGTVLLPSDVEEYESDAKLMEDIRSYLNRWHEAPNPLSRTLDVFYCFLSYIYDLIPQLPYRRYLAPWGKGKSAWLEALGWICYRGIVLAGSDTDKSVVRKMNNWRGTALIDEADFGDSSFYAFLVKILNIGYDHKTGFYHRSDDNDPHKTLSYCVYSAKLLATRQKYKDLALESRCLTTVGRQNVHAVPLFRMNKFLEEAQHLRNKLTLWRFRNYYRIKELASQLEDKGIASKVYNGAEGISSRVKQVILPLWLIAGDTMKQTLTELAQTIDNHLKIEDPEYLLELQARDAVKKISDLLEDDNDESVNIRNLVNILYEGSRAFYEIPLSTISRTILAERGMKEDEITVSDVTSISKSLKGVFETNLGFTMRIGKKRRRVIIIPADWVKVDSTKHRNLFDFEAGDSHKDVHQDTYVHQSKKKNLVEKFFPDHGEQKERGPD
jgi:hypothetical protein